MYVMNVIIGLAIFLITVTLHECAHGYAASWLGDQTARERGRLTLNPLRHIDPFWTVFLPVFLFVSSSGRLAIGQAKPVPVNYGNLRCRRVGTILVALAGPLANLVLAAVSAFLFHLTRYDLIRYLGVYLNLALAVFNLIPIPPLDGSRVVMGILPDRWNRFYQAFEPYGLVTVCVLYYFGFLQTLVGGGVNYLSRLFQMPEIW